MCGTHRTLNRRTQVPRPCTLQPASNTVGRPRRAAVIVQVAVGTTVLFGMSALAIDIGRLRVTRSELQNAADAASLAAAAQLAGGSETQSVREAAIAAANSLVQRNSPIGYQTVISGDDVEFGRAEYAGGKFTFQPGGVNFDAVRVNVQHTADGALLRVPYLFAPVLGHSGRNLRAQAAAVLIPRDIAVVIDLSGSMNDDSEVRHYKQYQGETGDWRNGIQANLRDIWCALDGPQPARPYVPGADDQTEYAEDTGPTIGVMSNWGTALVPETYDPTSDPGLWYIKKSVTQTDAAIRTSLQGRSYTADEITQLMSSAKDSSYTNQWRNRTAIMLGLGTWKSGRPGGRIGGNGDTIVQDGEVTWAAYPSYRVSWTWADYINYVASSSSYLVTANANFRYRFGLKTFTNFLLESVPQFNQTDILWQTPEQPLRAVKDAVQAMTDVIVGLESLDQMSLEIFAQTAHHEVNLSTCLQNVPDRLYHMQSAHYDSYTNMGAGLQTALNELGSVRARSGSAKVVMLMSDGKPNIDQYGNYVGVGNQAANDWVRQLATNAGQNGIRIYTISVGGDADQTLMDEIATLAGGQHFHAEGTPAQYADQLDQIFRSLGGKRPVALIE